jgi:hypothetical protein
VEFNVKDDEKNAQKTPPNAHFQELTCVGDDGRGKQQGLDHANEPLAEGDVFKHTLIGKAAEPLEQMPPDEQGLIAVDDPASRASEGVQE